MADETMSAQTDGAPLVSTDLFIIARHPFDKDDNFSVDPDDIVTYAKNNMNFTQGSVIFAGANGAITGDNGNFFWDNTNKRLGIGTTAPEQALHVQNNSASPRMRFSSTGNFGSSFDFNNGGATVSNSAIATVSARWNNSVVGQLRFRTGTDTTNKDDGRMEIRLWENGSAAFRLLMNEEETVFNSSGNDYDFRVQGDTLTHAIYLDASASTENIALLAGSAPNWQSMDGGVFIANASTVPTGNPSGGGFLYVENGAVKYRGSSGTVTPLGAA